MSTTTFSSKQAGIVAAVGGVVAAVIVAFSLIQFQAQAAETVLVRGVVKPGGSTNSVNLYITHVATASDPEKIRGIRTDVNVGKAKKFKWIVEDGELKKVRTTSNPVPEKEVVVRGTLLDDNRITAAWMVQNYREFHVEGVLQDRTFDTGSSDEGWVVINVTKSEMRGVPGRKFKETQIKGTDLRVRINGSTKLHSIGTSSDWTKVTDQLDGTKSSQVSIQFDEVSKQQQQVVVEGQLIDEDSWGASNYYQRNL